MPLELLTDDDFSMQPSETKPVESDLTELASDWVRYSQNKTFDTTVFGRKELLIKEIDVNLLVESHIANCIKFKHLMRLKYAYLKTVQQDERWKQKDSNGTKILALESELKWQEHFSKHLLASDKYPLRYPKLSFGTSQIKKEGEKKWCKLEYKGTDDKKPKTLARITYEKIQNELARCRRDWVQTQLFLKFPYLYQDYFEIKRWQKDSDVWELDRYTRKETHSLKTNGKWTLSKLKNPADRRGKPFWDVPEREGEFVLEWLFDNDPKYTKNVKKRGGKRKKEPQNKQPQCAKIDDILVYRGKDLTGQLFRLDSATEMISLLNGKKFTKQGEIFRNSTDGEITNLALEHLQIVYYGVLGRTDKIVLKALIRMFARGFYFDNPDTIRANIFQGKGKYEFDKSDFDSELAQAWRVQKQIDKRNKKKAPKAPETPQTPLSLKDTVEACDALRSTRCTPLNPNSSRSFMVLNIQGQNRDGQQLDFVFVDIAGEEHFEQTEHYALDIDSVEGLEIISRQGILKTESNLINTTLKKLKEQLDKDAEKQKNNNPTGLIKLMNYPGDVYQDNGTTLYTILLCHIRGVTTEDEKESASIMTTDNALLRIISNPQLKTLQDITTAGAYHTPPTGVGAGYTIEPSGTVFSTTVEAETHHKARGKLRVLKGAGDADHTPTTDTTGKPDGGAATISTKTNDRADTIDNAGAGATKDGTSGDDAANLDGGGEKTYLLPTNWDEKFDTQVQPHSRDNCSLKNGDIDLGQKEEGLKISYQTPNILFDPLQVQRIPIKLQVHAIIV